MRERALQRAASLLLGVAVLATVGVCETRATPSPRAPEQQAILAGAGVTVAAPSVAPAPPHALPPFTFAIALTPPSPHASSLSSLTCGTRSGKAPLYLRDRALLL